MDPAYIEILDTNKELRKELADEIADNDSRKKKIASLYKELDSCYKTISHHDSLIIAHEEEIASLKSEIISLKKCLREALQDAKQKEKHLLSREDQMYELENKISQLKIRIRELANKKNVYEIKDDMNEALDGVLDNRERTSACLARIRLFLDERGIVLPDFVRNEFDNIATALFEIIRFARAVEGHWENRSRLLEQQTQRAVDAERRLERTRIQAQRNNEMLTQARNDEADERRVWWLRTQRGERHIRVLRRDKVFLQLINRRRKAEADLAEFNRAWVFNRYQKWKAREINSRQIILNLQNNPPNMATMVEVNTLLRPQLSALPFYDGQEDPDTYYTKLRTINESARALAVAGFNPLERSNMMKGKMTGRFLPVPANNPYNGNNAINNEAEFLNWLQGKYREVMVGTNRDVLRALMNEKFTPMDTSDTYEKRIKPYAQGVLYAEVLPYLYEHMPQYMEMRLRQTAPANLDAFFTNLRTIWLETRGRVSDQQPPPTQTLAIHPQKDLSAEGTKAHDFMKRLAGDLQYTGLSSDHESLEKFIYEELNKRLGGKTAHVRKSLFANPQARSAYATKKVVRKIVPKSSGKLVRHCSVCGKAGHTKVNCPRVKRTKKVNYVYQDEVEDPDDSEEENIVEEEDDSEEEEIEDEDEYIDDDNGSRNCYAVKKKWSEVEYL